MKNLPPFGLVEDEWFSLLRQSTIDAKSSLLEIPAPTCRLASSVALVPNSFSKSRRFAGMFAPASTSCGPAPTGILGAAMAEYLLEL